MEFASPELDAVAPMTSDGRYEPLFAWYSRKCLPEVERAIREGRYKMAALLDLLDVRFLRPEELGDAWREGLLSNINRPEEYEKLKKSL